MNLQRIQEIDPSAAAACPTCGQQQAVTAYPGQAVSAARAVSAAPQATLAPQATFTPQATAALQTVSGGLLAPGSAQSAPITDTTQAAPMTVESTEYLNGFLRTQIGQQVRVSFLIGTNSFLDKAGKLLDVGANYIILQEAQTDDLLVCDFYTIKFVTVYH